MDAYTLACLFIGGVLLTTGLLIISEWLWPAPTLPPVADYEKHWARVDLDREQK